MTAANAPIWRKDIGFADDEWLRVPADAELPSAGEPALVAATTFLRDTERLLGHCGPLGVEIGAGESAKALAPYLWRLSLVAVAFPMFHDGRGYSTARLLRERYDFKGELRAVGDVLSDQIPLMLRCGFDSFEVRHGPTRAALSAGRLPAMRRFYQPVPIAREAPAGTRPWLRQAVE
jgi:phosphoadenosine phosphosulfate reductase